MTHRNLGTWAETPTRSLSPMDAAMNTLLQLVRTLAVDPTDAVAEEVQQRLAYGAERLVSRLEALAPGGEQPVVGEIRDIRHRGLLAYLEGHEELMNADTDDLLPAAERARQHFERGQALLNLAQAQVQDLLVTCPYIE